MKKLLFILAVVVLAVGCTDKPEYVPAGTDTPHSVTFTYDTALITSATTMFEQSLNRVDDIYRVNGQYVKFSMYLATDGIFYFTTSALIDADNKEINAGYMLDCEVAKIDGDFSNPTQVNYKSLLDEDFTWQCDLPDATEEQAPEAEQPLNVTVYKAAADARPAYVVRYKDQDENVLFGYVFTVQEIVLTETVTEEEIPSGKPYVDPVVQEVANYSNAVTMLYKAFDKNGNWVN